MEKMLYMFIGVGLLTTTFATAHRYRRRAERRAAIEKKMLILKNTIEFKVSEIVRNEAFTGTYREIAEDETRCPYYFFDWEDNLRSVEGKDYSVTQPLWDLLCWTLIRKNPALEAEARRVEDAVSPEGTTGTLIRTLKDRVFKDKDSSASAMIWLHKDVNKTTLSFYKELAEQMTLYRALEKSLDA